MKDLTQPGSSLIACAVLLMSTPVIVDALSCVDARKLLTAAAGL
jgi:hypothetical protein